MAFLDLRQYLQALEHAGEHAEKLKARVKGIDVH